MDMNAFFGITLSLIVLRWWWKNRPVKVKPRERPQIVLTDAKTSEALKAQSEAQKAQKEAQKQRERDVTELKKQGYTDELIATILPVIRDDNNQ